MIQLNNRQRDFVDLILKGNDLKLEELIDKFKISRRTVYNDIAKIREWADESEIKLITTTDSLLVLADEKSRHILRNILQDIIPFATPLNQLSRSNFVIAMVMFGNEPPTLNELCSTIGISRTTFYKDLEYVRYWFAKFDICLKMTKSNGLLLIGKESKIREAMVLFIRKNFDEFNLWMLLSHKESIHRFKDEKILIYRMIQNYFKKISFSLPLLVLQRLQKNSNDLIQDKEQLFFIWIFMVSLGRIERKHEIEKDDRFINCPAIYEKKVIEEMMNQNLYFKVNSDEAQALSFYYITAQSRSQKNNQLTINFDSQLMNFVEKISARLGMPLIRDSILIDGLREHILNTIERMKMGLVEVNLLKDEMMQRYPGIFEICAQELNKTLFFEKELEDDEIAYIVIYVAAAVERLNQSSCRVYAVCTSGRGSAELLLANLKNKLPDLNVLGTISIMNATHITKDQADAIIATTRITDTQIPVITVSPLLLKEDLIKIRKQLKIQSEDIHINLSESFTKNDLSFMDTMYLISDCANALDEIISELQLNLRNSVYIGILIHLMLQINQSENIKKIDLNHLSKEEVIIFKNLDILYSKYNRVLSEYDIRSIQMYIGGEKEQYEDIIKKWKNI